MPQNVGGDPIKGKFVIVLVIKKKRIVLVVIKKKKIRN